MSCNSSNKKKEFNYKKHEAMIVCMSSAEISEEKYDMIYDVAVDSIILSSNKELQFYSGKENIDWKLDSILCFNQKKNKMIGIIHKKCLQKDCKMDDMQYINGVNIKNKWYFFGGATISIPFNDYSSTSFQELHEIAIEEVFGKYLKKNKKTKEWEINEEFFADLTSTAWWLDGKKPANQEEWNNIYLRIVANNWKHKDTTNYERLRALEIKKK